MDRISFIAQRENSAMSFFRQGCNCSQAVLLAFSDVLGLDELTIKKVGSGLGGGMGRMREVCGTVSAMAIITGFLSPAADPADMKARKANYNLVQTLAEEFRKKNGSIVCRELLGLRSAGAQSPEPAERTAEYYAARPCERLVGDSAGIIAGWIFDNNFLKP